MKYKLILFRENNVTDYKQNTIIIIHMYNIGKYKYIFFTIKYYIHNQLNHVTTKIIIYKEIYNIFHLVYCTIKKLNTF